MSDAMPEDDSKDGNPVAFNGMRGVIAKVTGQEVRNRNEVRYTPRNDDTGTPRRNFSVEPIDRAALMEIRTGDGHVYRVYPEGRVSGFPSENGVFIVNNYLQILHDQVMAALESPAITATSSASGA